MGAQVKWLVPFIMVGIASVLCMWMLHVATWYYVMGIVRFEKAKLGLESELT